MNCFHCIFFAIVLTLFCGCSEKKSVAPLPSMTSPSAGLNSQGEDSSNQTEQKNESMGSDQQASAMQGAKTSSAGDRSVPESQTDADFQSVDGVDFNQP